MVVFKITYGYSIVLHTLHLLLAISNLKVAARAILVEPPQRSSLWRFKYNTTVNLRDDHLNCGGYDWQWGVHHGRCGVCGDMWNESQYNSDGGLYDSGIVVRTYKEGHYINVSSNYLGFVEFRLCPRNSSEHSLEQLCFDRYPLWIDESHSTRYYIGSRGGIYDIHIRLPEGVVCKQCVLQWKYKTGYRYDKEDSCKCRGCGKQEQYVNCADVEIGPRDGWDSSIKYEHQQDSAIIVLVNNTWIQDIQPTRAVIFSNTSKLEIESTMFISGTSLVITDTPVNDSHITMAVSNLGSSTTSVIQSFKATLVTETLTDFNVPAMIKQSVVIAITSDVLNITTSDNVKRGTLKQLHSEVINDRNVFLSTPNAAIWHTPNAAIGHTPNSAIGHTPDSAIGHTPNAAIGHTPDSAIGHTPNAAIGHTPDSAIGHTPDSAIGHTQDSAIGHTPDSVIWHTQDSAVGHTHDARQSTTKQTETFEKIMNARRVPHAFNTQFVSVSNILDRFYPKFVTPFLLTLTHSRGSSLNLPAGCDVSSDDFRCQARGLYNQSPGISQWCEVNCRANNCVQFLCDCGCEKADKLHNSSCHAIAQFKGVAGMDLWCRANCKVGYCPPNTCSIEDCLHQSNEEQK